MAHNTKKLDPTEAALSAIQEAMAPREPEASVPGRREAGSPEAAADGRGLGRATPAGADEDLFLDPSRAPVRSEDPAAPRRAANDDRQSVGQILQSIQRRPTRRSYVIATAFAAVWVIASIAGVVYLLPELKAQLLQGTPAVPALLGLGAGFLVPIFFVYVLAHMAYRSQELRLIAQSMTEVAIRLSEPETVARDSIVSVGQAIRREVAAMGDGVERALARAAELEALVHNEVSALERAYNDNEVRIRGLLLDLSSQREALVGQADQVRSVISGIQLDLTQDLTSVGDRVAETVNESAQRIGRILAERGENITQALGRTGDDMIATLDERGQALLERLERTSHHATGAITAASERLTSNLEFKSDAVHGTFVKLADDLSEMMAQRLDNVAQTFSERTTSVVDLMADRSGVLSASIADAGGQVAEALLTQVEDVNNTLKSTGDSLVLDFTLRGGEVVSQLEQTGARITDTIISRGNKVTETFRDTAESLAETVEVSGEAVKTMLATRLQAFEDMFSHGGTELAEKISRDSNTLGNLITRHLTEFDRTVRTYGGELVDRLADRTQDVAEALRSHIDGFDQRVATKTEEVGDSLDQRLVRFQEAIDSRSAAINDTVSARVIDITQTLAEGSREVIAALEQRIGEVTSVINVRGSEVADSLDTRITRFEELLIGRAEAVTSAIETRTKAAAETLGTRMEDLTQSIEVNAAAMRDTADATEQKLTRLSDEVTGALTSMSTEVSNVLRQNAGEVEQTLLGISTEVARNFVGTADEISNSVSVRADELTRILDEKSRMLLDALGGKSQQFAEEVARVTDHAVTAIETKGFAFTKSMVDNSESIARIINDASSRATTSVEQTLHNLEESTLSVIEQSKQTATATVSEMLETHSMLRSDTTALFERLREANILLQEVLSGAHENMSSLEHTMVTRVSEFVATMNTLTERSGAASTQAEEHIESFNRVTTRVLGDLSQLAGEFETHGRSLASAVELIDRSNRRTAETLSERRMSLETLVSELDSRTEDLSARLSRFSSLLDDSLEAAANRARDIARVIADSSLEGQQAVDASLETAANRAREIARVIAESSLEGQQAVDASFDTAASRAREIARVIAESSLEGQQAVDASLETAANRAREIAHAVAAASREGAEAIMDNFKLVRTTTEQERQRTLESLRGIFEQVSDESGNMFGQAAERFHEVMRDMKQMAAEMKRELDATRGELRRGVLEMPQETAESAAQMRRVIVDQIEALAELNRIVARHGRGLDAAEPTARRIVRDEPVAANGSPRLEPPQRPVVRVERAERPDPVPPRRADSPSLSPAMGNGRSGWLSELLNRASRELGEAGPEEKREPARETGRGDERTPRHSIESLDSLSVDIARMIDHDAAAELWDRYRRGERNVFTRRLYTLQGQQAFDEIRRKYRADREFKQTVDRYIDEFERLLEDVARDDRGQVVARTYLTSETGKVYTMLAHAAGRFD